MSRPFKVSFSLRYLQSFNFFINSTPNHKYFLTNVANISITGNANVINVRQHIKFFKCLPATTNTDLINFNVCAQHWLAIWWEKSLQIYQFLLQTLKPIWFSYRASRLTSWNCLEHQTIELIVAAVRVPAL